MPLDPDFIADCPYLPDGLFIDDVIEIDETGHGRIVLNVPPHDDLPLTSTQRVHPTRHPRHIAGGVIIHLTGIAGFAHAYYILGIRHMDGWTGYGARISSGRFHNLGNPAEPMQIEATAKQVKRGAKRILGRYDFRFTQNDALIYEGDQTAMFVRVE
jgi:hypothetical protein